MIYLFFFVLLLYIVKIDVGYSVMISVGGFQVIYNIDQFYFYWGENFSIGLEYMIDSYYYLLEVGIIMVQFILIEFCINLILILNY